MSTAATVAIHTIRAPLRSQIGQHVADEGVGENGERSRGGQFGNRGIIRNMVAFLTALIVGGGQLEAD